MKRILVFHNGTGEQVSSTLRLLDRKWPQCAMLMLVKRRRGTVLPPLPPLPARCHVLYRDNPMPVCKGFAIMRRLAKMRFDVSSAVKQELTLKILLGMFLLQPREFVMVQGVAEQMAVQRMTRSDFLKWLLRQRQRVSSAIIALVPFMVLCCQLPLMLARFSPWRSKKDIIGLIYHNIVRGPLADSPWLFMWLQVAMANAFIWARKPSQTPQRICVSRIDHVGDNINTIPLVRALRKDFPAAHITLLCDIGEFVWRNCPYIDEVLIYRTNNRLLKSYRPAHRMDIQTIYVLSTTPEETINLIIDPVGRTESHIISYLCTGARRISNTYYPYELYGIETPLRHYQTLTHETVRALALWRPEAEITETDTRLEVWLPDSERKKASSVFTASGVAGDRPCVGIHPGAMSRLRLWPIERFGPVAQGLHAAHGMQIVYFEPPGAEAMTATFMEHLSSMGASAAVVRAADLRSLMAMIARCDLFVCVDSGPMHLAAACSVPTVAIFGPGEYWRWQPRENGSRIVRQPLDCAPCSQDRCLMPECMLKVQEKDVLEACELILAHGQPRRA